VIDELSNDLLGFPYDVMMDIHIGWNITGQVKRISEMRRGRTGVRILPVKIINKY
jgi:hypothetical protein